MSDKQPKRVKDVYDVVRRLSWITREVAVGFSCGKDASACLTLCCEWFDRVLPFHLYYVPNLSFHDTYIRYMEQRFGHKFPHGKVLRLPHWGLSNDLYLNYFRPRTAAYSDVPQVTIKDVEIYVRKETGFEWVAYGMKKNDSLERRGMLNKCRGIELVAHRAFPLCDWSHRTVTQYLRSKDVPLSPEYQYVGSSASGQVGVEEIKMMRDHYPDDLKRFLARYPDAEAEAFRYESGLMDGIATGRTSRQA